MSANLCQQNWSPIIRMLALLESKHKKLSYSFLFIFQLATRHDSLKVTHSSLGCDKSRIITRNCREKEDKNTRKSRDKDLFFLQLEQRPLSFKICLFNTYAIVFCLWFYTCLCCYWHFENRKQIHYDFPSYDNSNYQKWFKAWMSVFRSYLTIIFCSPLCLWET